MLATQSNDIQHETQYRQLKPAIDRRIQAVLDHEAYIMGPEVAELETQLATYVDSKPIFDDRRRAGTGQRGTPNP